jgi:hypothetical protein
MGYSKFKDVSASNWARRYINYMAGRGVVRGTGDDTFNPNGLVSIAEICIIAVRELGRIPAHAMAVRNILAIEERGSYTAFARECIDFVGKTMGVRLVPQGEAGAETPVEELDIGTQIQRQYAFNVIWQAVASKRLGLAVFNNEIYEDYFEKLNFQDHTWVNRRDLDAIRNSIYQLAVRHIVTGRKDGGDNRWLAPAALLTRAELCRTFAMSIASVREIAAYDASHLQRRLANLVNLPNGYESYRFPLMYVCTDGWDYSFSDRNEVAARRIGIPAHVNPQFGSDSYQRRVSAFNVDNENSISATTTPYIVIADNHPYRAERLRDYGVVINHATGNFIPAIVADVGPADMYREVSLKAAWDLGFTVEQANGRWGPRGDFEFIIFKGTRILPRTATEAQILDGIRTEVPKYFKP